MIGLSGYSAHARAPLHQRNGPGHFEEAFQHLDTLVANYTDLDSVSPTPSRDITHVL